MRRTCLVAATAVLATAVSACGVLGGGGDEADLQIYSARHYDLEEAFAAFEAETGVSVEFIYGDDAELLERLDAEGDETPADVFMTVDAGGLWNAAERGELAAVRSPTLDKAVPKDLRDPDGRWFGLAMRARTVTYNPDTVDPSELDTTDTYAALADPKWQDRLCMRDSTASYTQSLVASLIDLYGRDRTLEIVQGWVDNDVEIMSNDILLLEAIDAGVCDVGINNHYYLARELEADPGFPVAPAWPEQDGAGAHANLSGAGVVQTTDRPSQAQRLIEFLVQRESQEAIAAEGEFPANPDVVPAGPVAEWAGIKTDPMDVAGAGSHADDAVQLMADVGWE